MSRHSSASHFHKSKTLNDKYIIGDEIGKGAYGRVYKGLDLENGDFVAIKQVSLENIPPEDLASIMQEIDLLKNLNHKNIVKYRGSIKTKTHLYIILEYVENGSLASIVKPNKFGAFPESLVAVYIAQVLEGLAYLHEQGVIHRDIKGANILTTKEGFVKLADFGVATKLTEADVNTHSVVGTPYWMAPEVVEMSGVSASSDIWSVGCTVIELLTCVPPYYDLQPMPALFRIVQDERPPIPEHLSPGLTDFLHQCFQKDAKLRPDAKTLLKHSWIRNSRRALQNSLRLSNIPQDVSTVLERSIEDSKKEDRKSSSPEPATSLEFVLDDDAKSRSQELASVSVTSEANGTKRNNDLLVIDESSQTGDQDEPEGSLKAPRPVVFPGTEETMGRPEAVERSLTPERLMSPPQEVDEMLQHPKMNSKDLPTEPSQSVKGVTSTIRELSKFSDTPADGILDDLFEDFPAKVERKEDKSPAPLAIPNSGRDSSALVKKLNDKMARKRAENKNGETNFIAIVDAVEDEDFDSTGLVSLSCIQGFDGNVEGRDYYGKQAVEVTRLIGLLKPEEPEEAIVSTCQKLVSVFREFPEQKSHLILQHGIMPLLEMLEVNNNRVMHAVLQLINQIVKDSSDIQENACLAGLIPVVMNFAAPEKSKEMRMQAAYFVQQMCNSSNLTLQMFIACRGLPVLVGFLESDYAKYREMVHLAIDCMWQVFELKSPTPRNDFCRIFSKSGVLVRLVNTLHSLNEAARLASASGAGNSAIGGETTSQRSRSGPLEPSRVYADHIRPRSGQLDPLRVRHDFLRPPTDSPKAQQPQKSPLAQPESSKQGEYGGDGKVLGHNRRRSSSQERMPPEVSGRTEKTAENHSDQWHLENGSDMPRKSYEQLPPLLSMLDKESTRPATSGRATTEKADSSFLPLLHHSGATRKNNGDLETLMRAFAEKGDIRALGLSQEGSSSNGLTTKQTLPQQPTAEMTASTSGLVSQSASGLLSLSGVLNGRPGSATSSGVLTRMTSTLNAEVAREYLVKVADLLLEFSRADTVVKSSMCSLSLLIRLFTMLSKLEPPILLKILKCISQLSMDPYTLEPLQRADAMKHLVPLLEGQYTSQIHNQVLNALYNLCKINKRRQEQAAECGIIPHLLHFITTNSPLKKFALPLLCDMAHASRYTREQLRAHKGLDVYLNLLDDEFWAVTALDSLAVCLAHDNDQRKVESALVRKDSVQKLVAFFQSCSGSSFVHILEPFLKIITKSPRLNTALAVSGLTPLLVGRLDHQDAIARLNLLKLIKAVYEHHPRPKQLIVEHDLPSKLQKLIEERHGERSGGQVLVKQMATALLKALHINTVL
ncbi:MAP3K epsilon protein kinase 1 isoform X1 [Selaginella moellendorffii]|uniref:MAP3K epsilon protein kinase 1 isoform X1 n=1 Tax=Selaginella moellendorffii TaxID=88036 RepID=UPI000D1C264A|nr:MAP3K epsilon protein kinase 1 isoform X1 [Selaginella moellendorffii]|eukprot:XP_024545433.1 MAP3K epsilon protein kinase 1 isoform X1 [Selaginella moellendorffii]